MPARSAHVGQVGSTRVEQGGPFGSGEGRGNVIATIALVSWATVSISEEFGIVWVTDKSFSSLWGGSSGALGELRERFWIGGLRDAGGAGVRVRRRSRPDSATFWAEFDVGTAMEGSGARRGDRLGGGDRPSLVSGMSEALRRSWVRVLGDRGSSPACFFNSKEIGKRAGKKRSILPSKP